MARCKKKHKGKSPQPVFRSQVEAEAVDRLLCCFAAVVKKGLELMLTDPSDLAKGDFREYPELSYTATGIPALLPHHTSFDG